MSKSDRGRPILLMRLAAQQMTASGDWMIPRRGPKLYAHEPPPFMRTQAASHGLTGD